MNNIHKSISLDKVQAGDVLLCCTGTKRILARRIGEISNSNYTHAAICIGDGKAAGAGRSGIEVETLKQLVQSFDHVAVFRQPDAWSPRRIKILNVFVEAALAAGAAYNVEGLKKFVAIKEVHENSLHERLTDYFEGTFEQPKPGTDDNYTCSEFVAAVFIITGFIEPSASIVYEPGAIAPGELGRDPTWGTFAGYASLKEGYEIPVGDEFYNETTYAKIFEDE